MTSMIGISFMSPVEKPIIIPLEYHRIDNEFTTTDNNNNSNNNHNHNNNNNNNNNNSSNYSNNNQRSQKKENNIKNFKNFKKTVNNIVNNNHISNRNNDIIKKAINNNDDDNNDNESSHKNDKNDKNDTLIINNNHNQNNYYIKNELYNSNSNGNCNNNNENNSRISNEKCQQDNSNVSDDNNYPKYKRNRQIFGIQLEVTSLLLVAERRKLNVLQKELQIALEDSGSIKKAKENFKQELILAISRIQSQYDLLENEYKQHAIGRLRNSKTRGTGKSNRSQPAIGLKQTPKARPTIFGTVASDQYPKDNANKRALPQTTNISNSSSSSAAAIRKTNDKQISQLSSSSSSSSETATAFIQNSSACNEGKDTNTVVATEENSLVYRDGNLISGPLDALIQHMVPTSDYYPDRSYIFAFLLSARLFIRPYKLLEKICQLCEEQQNFSCKLQDTITTTTTKGTTETKNNDKNHYLDFENFCNNSCSGLDIGKIDCDNQNQHHMTNNGDDEECCKKLKKFAQNFVQLLAEWIDTFPYDFRDDRLMQHLRLMSKKCVCIDSNLRKDVSTMLQNLLHRLTVLDKYEEFLQSISNDSNDCPTNSILIPSSSNSAGSTTENRTLCGSSSSSGSTNIGTSGTTSTAATSNQNSSMQQQQQSGNTYHGQTIGNQIMNASGILHHTNSSSSSSSTSNCLHSSSSHSTNSILSSIDIIELCPNPTLLAHQLTHIELERLSHIGPEEFVQAFAKENPHLEQSFNDIKKTRNLESYIQWFNRLSYFVATEIVKHCKKKQRVRIVEYWIETARECFNIGNFNSLMAIIAGLNMSPISRLKKTWAKVQSAKFSVLEHQMDPSSNFNSYRSTLKAAMWRSAGATDERERIVIPFFSLLVKDLYFLNEGCSNKLANGHVNFEKFWQLAKQVTEFIAWKQVTCPFEKIPKVIMFLYTNHILNENMLALASFECEPPENHEKDRYKCLKSEQQQQYQQQQQQQQQQLNQQQQQQHYHYHQQQ